MWLPPCQRVHEVSGGKDCQVHVKTHGKHKAEGSIEVDDVPANSGLNLGVLLLEFLQLYGHRLNYERVGISLRNGGSYFRKSDRYDRVGVPSILQSVTSHRVL